MQRKMTAMMIVATLFLVAASGCDESDLVAVRLELAGDLSGKVTTRSLKRPSGAGPLESSTSGVDWKDRVDIQSATGDFASLSGLSVADIKFAGDPGSKLLTVTIPLGSGASWPEAFTISNEDQRKKAAATFDATGSAKKVGATVKIVVTLPGEVVAHGAQPSIAGLKEEVDKKEASIVIPVKKALSENGEITWQITWK